jgi:hypothetical protein
MKTTPIRIGIGGPEWKKGATQIAKQLPSWATARQAATKATTKG